jgi:hypothetical protein
LGFAFPRQSLCSYITYTAAIILGICRLDKKNMKKSDMQYSYAAAITLNICRLDKKKYEEE